MRQVKRMKETSVLVYTCLSFALHFKLLEGRNLYLMITLSPPGKGGAIKSPKMVETSSLLSGVLTV